MVGAAMLDPQADPTVVEEQFLPGLDRLEHLRMRQPHPARVARRLVEIEPELLALGQRDRALGEGTDPEFRALQVGHRRDRAAELLLQGADRLQPLRVILPAGHG